MEGKSDHWGVEAVYSRRRLAAALGREYEPLPPFQAAFPPATCPNTVPVTAVA
ncbi:hypothetical protein [Streptomyces sp. NPDC051132]|uniref:hypothetical protein n=1 Tax=unclassified Streptomyces TaxID=2593676 RepID=UPI003415A9C5